MPNQELIDYISQMLKQGKSRDEIKHVLTENGWQPQDIEEAFTAVSQNPSKTSSSVPLHPIDSTLQDIGDLFHKSLRLYRERFRTFLGIPVIFTAIFVIIYLFLSFTVAILSFSNIFLFIIGIILFNVLYAWGEGSLLFAIKQENNSSIGQSLRKGWNKMGPFFWVNFLSYSISLGVSLLSTLGISLILFPLVYAFRSQSSILNFGILSLIPFGILSLIPAILFRIWFSFSAFVVIAEDIRGVNALLKSKEYIKGRFFYVLFRELFIGILVIILILLLYIIGAFVIKPLSALFVLLLSIVLITPFQTIYLYLLYTKVKLLKGEFNFVPSAKTKKLLIVVGILGPVLIFVLTILTSVGLVILNPADKLQKARDTQRIRDEQVISTSLRNYFTKTGSYPVALNQLYLQELRQIPTDPKTKRPYKYTATQDGKDYRLCVEFEKIIQVPCVNSESNIPRGRPKY